MIADEINEAGVARGVGLWISGGRTTEPGSDEGALSLADRGGAGCPAAVSDRGRRIHHGTNCRAPGKGRRKTTTVAKDKTMRE